MISHLKGTGKLNLTFSKFKLLSKCSGQVDIGLISNIYQIVQSLTKISHCTIWRYGKKKLTIGYHKMERNMDSSNNLSNIFTIKFHCLKIYTCWYLAPKHISNMYALSYSQCLKRYSQNGKHLHCWWSRPLLKKKFLATSTIQNVFNNWNCSSFCSLIISFNIMAWSKY